MSGSIAAIAAYDGTGTQGYGTTDKNLPGVKSIFWNENDTDKYYVNGSALIDIPVNNSEIAFNQTQPAVFTFPNDIDAVGRIYVHVTINNPTNVPVTNSNYNNKTGIIDFIELCVGNQIIVSKNFAQIFSIQTTQYYQGDYGANGFPGRGGQELLNKVKFIFDLDIMENTSLGNNDINLVYLMACANNQTLQLKIYPSTSATLSARGFNSVTWDTINFQVFSRLYSMVNDERNFLRNQVIPKLFKVTQYSDRVIVPSSPSPESPIIVNCDSFNIDAKSIDIYIPPTYNQQTVGFDVELFLNSTSYSGLVPFTLGLQDSPAVTGTLSNQNSESPNFRLNLSTRTVSGLNKSDLVPLSKYDSIKVYIYFQSGLPHGQSDLDILTNGIIVVADGYCTALYQNGAVTFNNY